jgi:hypothetical protein
MAGVCWHVGSLRSARATFEVTYTLLKAPNKSEDYLLCRAITNRIIEICMQTQFCFQTSSAFLIICLQQRGPDNLDSAPVKRLAFTA